MKKYIILTVTFLTACMGEAFAQQTPDAQIVDLNRPVCTLKLGKDIQMKCPLYKGYIDKADLNLIYYNDLCLGSSNIVDDVSVNSLGEVKAYLKLNRDNEVIKEFVELQAAQNKDFKKQIPDVSKCTFQAIPFTDAQINIWQKGDLLASINRISAFGYGAKDSEWDLPLVFPTVEHYQRFVEGVKNNTLRFNIKLFISKVGIHTVSVSSTVENEIISEIKNELGANKVFCLDQNTFNEYRNRIKLRLESSIKANDPSLIPVAASLDAAADQILMQCFVIQRDNIAMEMPDTQVYLTPAEINTSGENTSDQSVHTARNTDFKIKTRSRGGAVAGQSIAGSARKTTTTGNIHTIIDENGNQIDTNDGTVSEGIPIFGMYKCTVRDDDVGWDIQYTKNMEIAGGPVASKDIEMSPLSVKHQYSQISDWCAKERQKLKEAALAEEYQRKAQEEALKEEFDEAVNNKELLLYYIDSYSQNIYSNLAKNTPDNALRDKRINAAKIFLKDPIWQELYALYLYQPSIKDNPEMLSLGNAASAWDEFIQERLSALKMKANDSGMPKKKALEKLVTFNQLLGRLNDKIRHTSNEMN